MKNYKYILLGASMLALAACSSTLDRLEEVSKPPHMTDVQNPTIQPDYKPVTWPMPETPLPAQKHAGSLWQPGSRAFFRDQRANRVGDIVRVKISISDTAQLDNSSQRARTSSEDVAAPALYGLENKLGMLTPGTPDPTNLFDISGSTNNSGSGSVKRQEKITTTIAAQVTQMLPNGNMVIEGKQEVRVNYELREVAIKGVVRPQDISSDNTIDSSQIAEARINYGGRGQIIDVQQPRWGHQLIDILSPF